MRLKRFFATMMVLATLVSCFGVNVSAVENSKDDAVIVVRATGKFDMEVPGNTTVKASTSFPLEIGEIVTIKATYSPFSANVDAHWLTACSDAPAQSIIAIKSQNTFTRNSSEIDIPLSPSS